MGRSSELFWYYPLMLAHRTLYTLTLIVLGSSGLALAQSPPCGVAPAGSCVGEASHIILGKIIETGTDAISVEGGSTSYIYAIVQIQKVLRGDRAKLVKSYRRTFPLFSPTIHYFSGGHGNMAPTPVFELDGKKGQRLIFFVHLPTVSSSTTGEVPPKLRARYGKYNPTLFRTAPLDELKKVQRAIAAFTKSQRQIRQRASSTTHSDRFTQALGRRPPPPSGPTQAVQVKGQAGEVLPSPAVKEVLSFVTQQVQQKLGLTIKARLSPSKTSGTFTYQLHRKLDKTGAAGLWGTLTIITRPEDGLITAWDLEGAAVMKLGRKPHGKTPGKALLDEARKSLKLKLTGPGIQSQVNMAQRGDGLNFFEVQFDTGQLYQGNSIITPRYLNVSYTAEGLLPIAYRNGWHDQ